MLLSAAPTWGQDSRGEDEAPTATFLLHPAAEPKPALKYQLVPGILERRPGNAAVLYGKVTAEQTRLFGNEELWDKIMKGMEAPLAEVRDAKELQSLRHGSVYRFLDRAARCEECDWQLPIGEEPFYEMLLPDAHQTRSFARLLAVKARMEIADGRYDEAVHTLTTGYRLGRHVAEGETLIYGVVGLAISGIMSRQVRDLIQEPDAPNLYWALASLPRPLVDIRSAVEAERDALYLSYPELRPAQDVATDDLPATDDAHWRRVTDRLAWVAAHLGDDWKYGQRAWVTLMTMKKYPMAKAWLADRGFSREAVDAMPVPEVVARYTLATYDELRDETFKWFYVPYWKAREEMKRTDELLKQSMAEGREIIPVAGLLLPAVQAVRTAVVRTDREIAAIRVLEAIRMYAAGHDGRLPEGLDDIEVPVPDDPVTGGPFQYELRGESAVLSGTPLPAARLKWEIKMVR